MSKSLCHLLKEAVEEEGLAEKGYSRLAELAEKQGQPDVAESLKDIGEDQKLHVETLRDLIGLLKCPIEEKK